MNARLKKSFGFYTGTVFEDRFMVNHFNVELNLVTVSGDNAEQNIAYERMKYWIFRVMDDSILIENDSSKLQQYLDTGARLLVLPDEPVDQIVGIMLYLKLNAIMENRMVVTDVEIWSTQGDSMSYIHSHGENVGPGLAQNGWWLDPKPTWHAGRPRGDGKIVSLDRVPEWKDFGLDWDQDKDDGKESVVFANFARDEDQ
jgi:hypothetical protein